MRSVRCATASGVLYPADEAELARVVDGLLADASPLHPQLADGVPKAIVVPHDAYPRSGLTAAAAYARLRPWRHSLRSVVVVGAASGAALPGLTLTHADAFATPLGNVTVDQPACDQLRGHAGVWVDDDLHSAPSGVEVQLPFLQRLLAGGWVLVPALCAAGDPVTLADALEPLWDDPSTLLVISSNLSSGHDDRTSRYLDRRTSAAIVSRWWEAVGEHEVSAATGVRALLELARRHQCQVELVDLATSADRGGGPDHVTGYGSFVVR